MVEQVKRMPLKDVPVGIVFIIPENISTTEVRETYYVVREGEASRPKHKCIARLATIQGIPGEDARYVCILPKPCVDPGEIHEANQVFTDLEIASVGVPFLDRILDLTRLVP